MFLQHGSPRRVRAFAPSTTRLERRRVVSLHAFGEAWRGEGGEIDWESARFEVILEDEHGRETTLNSAGDASACAAMFQTLLHAMEAEALVNVVAAPAREGAAPLALKAETADQLLMS